MAGKRNRGLVERQPDWVLGCGTPPVAARGVGERAWMHGPSTRHGGVESRSSDSRETGRDGPQRAGIMCAGVVYMNLVWQGQEQGLAGQGYRGGRVQ